MNANRVAPTGRGALFRRGVVVVCLVFASASLIISPAYGQPGPWPGHDRDYKLDSGLVRHSGSSGSTDILWSDVIEVPEALWLRLFFWKLELGFDPATGRRAVLRMTSVEDGATQHLDARTARQWSDTSAYFNGPMVLLELLVDPGAPPSRVVLDRVRVGDPAPRIDSICGRTDDRTLSDDPRIGRGEAGCSHWIINDPHHCLLSAGHCEFSFLVIEFNVPLSDSNGQKRHPKPEDQYAVDPESIQSLDGGMGRDWGYYGLFPNSETGQTAFQAQGDAFTIAAPPEPTGRQPIRITGYGITYEPTDPRWSWAQKTHVGRYLSRDGTKLNYDADTTSGNSGSPVILEDSGTAIGVHTHGACYESGGWNTGTALDNSDLQFALSNPIGICGYFTLEVEPLRAGQNSVLTARGVEPFSMVIFTSSVFGLGEWPVPELGVTLGVNQPFMSGVAIADADGVAVLSRRVNVGGRGMRVWSQAACLGRTSQVVESVIE